MATDTALIAELCGVPGATVILARSASAAFSNFLSSLDLPDDAEVLLPVSICVSMVLAVLSAGAVPILVDCDDRFAMAATAAARQLTRRSRVLVFHHPFGLARDLSPIRRMLSQRPDIIVVEDCAQAPGTTVRGRKSGSAGDVALLSFGARKPIDAGIGGALVVPRADRAEVMLAAPNVEASPNRAERARIRGAVAAFDDLTARRLAKVASVFSRRGAVPAGPPENIYHRLVLGVGPTLRARAVERFSDICQVPQPPLPSWATPGLRQRYETIGRADLWDAAGEAFPAWHALAATRLLVRTDSAVRKERLRQLCQLVGAA